MDAASSVRAYYDALREGDPLYPYFASETTTVKFGIGERLTGYEAVRAGLAEQTETMPNLTVVDSSAKNGYSGSPSRRAS